MATSTTQPLPLIYIAGPFRGPTPLDVRRNVERARDFGLIVARCGGYPVIPHTMTADFDKQLDDQFWLDGTMALLNRCDAILMIDKWQQSIGANAEYTNAVVRSLPTFFTSVENWSYIITRWVAAWQANEQIDRNSV